MFKLTYAHCVKATAGECDREPFTSYVFKTVDAEMYRVRDEYGSEPDSFIVKVDDVFAGAGDTKEDAAGDAQYRLMNRSRAAAYVAAGDTRDLFVRAY